MIESFQKLFDACAAAELEARDAGTVMPLWNINPETYRFWTEQPGHVYPLDRGNSKARRRWRRREIPNSQRTEAITILHERIDTLAAEIGAQR